MTHVGKGWRAGIVGRYALVGVIEIERHRNGNPAVPTFLVGAYEQAIQELAACALDDLVASRDPTLVASACGIICLARGLPRFGRLLLTYEDDELPELLAADGDDRSSEQRSQRPQ